MHLKSNDCVSKCNGSKISRRHNFAYSHSLSSCKLFIYYLSFFLLHFLILYLCLLTCHNYCYHYFCDMLIFILFSNFFLSFSFISTFFFLLLCFKNKRMNVWKFSIIPPLNYFEKCNFLVGRKRLGLLSWLNIIRNMKIWSAVDILWD